MAKKKAAVLELSSPSEAFPGPPALRITAADGWEAMPMASAILALSDSRSPEEFRVNLVVTSARILNDASLSDVVGRIRGRLAAMATVQVQGSSDAEIAGFPASLCAYTLEVPPYPHPLFQVDAALMVPTVNPGARDLVQLHATCPAGLADHYGATFRTMMNSLVVD